VDFGPTLLELAGIDIPVGIDGIPFLGEEISPLELDKRDVTYGYADRFDEKYDLVRTVRKGRMKYIRNYQPFNFDGLQNNYRYKCLAYQQWREMYIRGALDEIQGQFFEAREPEALYDLERDPYETTNLVDDSDYSDRLIEMRSLLNNWVKGMPDLSFYPENKLMKQAFSNPVAFGRENISEIGELVDVADLSLLPFKDAREGIAAALDSDNPVKVYWGLISCSCFGTEAKEFFNTAKSLCSHDDLLVRTRAAEFLGLSGAMNPAPVILEALGETYDPIEALLILNSLVLLRDGTPAYTFNLSELKLHTEVSGDAQVQRRMEYLSTDNVQP
jgi:hypothetical protein